MLLTYQNPARSGLSGNKFARPVFGLCHERPLELLLALAGRLLFFLFRVIRGEFGLLTAAEEREHSPEEHDQQSCQEGKYAGQQETPPLAFFEAFRVRSRAAGDDLAA